MQTPVQITFHDVPHMDAVEERIREEAANLDQVFDNITSCRVVVEAQQRRQRKGRIYFVHVEVNIPGTQIVVGKNEQAEKNTHEDVLVAVRDAFDTMERRLLEYKELRKGGAKIGAAAPHARVSKLFPDEGYGFIESFDGREIYFHRNSVLNDAFNRLKVGDEVRYNEEPGLKGPQASTVDLVGKEAKHTTGTHSLG